jgi:hypothetical protein
VLDGRLACPETFAPYAGFAAAFYAREAQVGRRPGRPLDPPVAVAQRRGLRRKTGKFTCVDPCLAARTFRLEVRIFVL